MKLEFTKAEQELLEHAKLSCGCESYYHYHCGKCKDTGNGFVVKRRKAYDALEKAGLVEHDSYHGLVLTEAGRKIMDAPWAPKKRDR